MIMSEEKQAASDAAQATREAEVTRLQAIADAKNKELGKSKGKRHRVGQTRGKNPKVITWLAWDTEQPETLPATQEDFMILSGIESEPLIVSYLIDGENAAAYSAASDVLAEYCEPNWSDATSKTFKSIINGYVQQTGVSVEDAVALMKPGIMKAMEARLAAASA
jgi:hypothetical protein